MFRGTLVLTVAALLFLAPALFAQIVPDYDSRIDNVTGNRIEDNRNPSFAEPTSTPTPTPTPTVTPVNTPQPTPVPTPPPWDYLFSIDQVSGNWISSFSTNFTDEAKYDVVEIISGHAKGKRFFVDKNYLHSLSCQAGLLNDYTVSVEAAGVVPGAECAVLPTDQIVSGSCTPSALNTLTDSSGTAAWPTDIYRNFYVFLTGPVGTTTVYSFFSITNNTSDTFSVDGLLSGLPVYTGAVSYLIVTNPPVVQTKPQLLLGTNSYPDPICETCIRLGITYTLIPLPNTPQWNPLNQVDPYVAARLPTGQLLFFNNGRWHTETKPVYRSLVVGDDASGVLGVFLMGPPLPSGKYTLYGVLNTPGASVYNDRYWRSDLSTTDFIFP